MTPVNHSRLSFARRRRGLTKKALADLLDVTDRTISYWEAGEMTPSDETLKSVSEHLRFPVTFFFGDDLNELRPDIVSFRALSRMTSGQRDAALAAGALGIAVGDWIEKRFNLPDPDVPDMRDLGPEEAAAAVRASWGVGVRPISDMVRLLESRGVFVFSLVEDCKEVDAYSFWHEGRRPFVMLNTIKSAERSRLDAAHELGHLVLHRHADDHQRIEIDAQRFASAFLMPREDVIAHAPRIPSVDSILRGKVRWRVSAMAYAHRLSALGLLSPWQYRRLCQEMASSGFRSSEPNPQPRESSLLLKKVLESLRQEGHGRRVIAGEINIYVEELDRLLFGLVPAAISGGKRDHKAAPCELSDPF